MNTKEFISFAKLQSKILSESNIYWNPSCEDKYKNDLLVSIENSINNFLKRYFNNLISIEPNILNIIYSVEKHGKDFKYSYIRDLPIFKKDSNIKSVEDWWNESKLIILENGDSYIIQYENFGKGRIIIQKIDSIPKQYKPTELFDIISKLLEPLLQFNLENNEETIFIHSEISKHIPFKPHTYMEHKEKVLIEIWENSIKRNHTYMNRSYIYAIKTQIINNLSIYENEYDEIPEWKPLLQNTLKEIAAL